jgi:hypothetical protein
MLLKQRDQTSFWANQIHRYRSLLLNPDCAPKKVVDDFQTEASDFDERLLDIFSEVLGVVKLAELGAADFLAY